MPDESRKSRLFSSDVLAVIVITLGSFFLFGKFDILEMIVEFSAAHEEYEVDEIISSMIVMALCLIVLLLKRWRESVMAHQLIAEQKQEIQAAMEEVKSLQGIIPICASCKSIRSEDGAWNQLESYIRTHSDAEFSHGLCPDCEDRHLPEIKYSEFKS